MRAAIYAGSFDPVTNGHLDIIKRAANAFDKVYVVIGNNPSKKYLLSLWVRNNLLKTLTANMPTVEIAPIGNRLLVDFAYERGVKHIIKGVRNEQDFNYERAMHEINVTQWRGIETHILISRPDLSHVSSSAVKELAKFHGIVQDYVPMIVKETIEYAYNQIVIGITGSIATGKSTLTNAIMNRMGLFGRVSHVDLDKLAHDLLEPKEDSSPMACELRGRIFDEFQTIDRKELGAKVFGNPKALGLLNEMFREPLLFKVRQEMNKAKVDDRGRGHIILLNGALLAEANLLSLCNNNVIITHTNPSDVMERLKARGFEQDQSWRRIKSQYSYEQKLKIINDRIAKDGCGYVSSVDTSKGKNINTEYSLVHWECQMDGFKSKNQCDYPETKFTL